MSRRVAAIDAVRLALLALALGLADTQAQAAQQPLRVCADPNNLPYSNAAGEGFENKIVGLIAAKLDRPLEFVWRAQRRGFVREGLNAGECDLIAATPPGVATMRTTRPYYRSTFVFLSRPGEPPVSSLDDPSLRARKVGVQMIGDNGMNSPPAHALAERGIVNNVRGFMVYGDYRKDEPLAQIARAVGTGEVDVAAVWGPTAGYFARAEKPPLVLTPIEATSSDQLPMTFDIAMGLRKTDGELADEVQRALDALGPQIKAILRSYNVPLVAEAP